MFVVQPLLLQATELWIQCDVSDGNEFTVTSCTLEADAARDRSVHCKGGHEATRARELNPVELCGCRCGKANTAAIRPMYLGFDAGGLHYGPDFRKLEQVWVPAQATCDEAMATLLFRSAMGAMHVHPADLDCTQHLELLLAPFHAGTSDGPRLPFAYDEVLLRRARGELHPVCACERKSRPAPSMTERSHAFTLITFPRCSGSEP